MKKYLIVFTLLLSSASYSFCQSSTQEEIEKLSMDKWEWMADKDVANLETLFDKNAKFVHMSGTWTTERELEIIESGSIWYQKA